MEEKNIHTSGADEKTPSRGEYFSWINNTNEGSTEKQTLANLNFFRYLQKTFGMNLDIYAWDAGNLDGANNSYQTLEGEKLSLQYPNGYFPIVSAAAKQNIRLGVWGGADGYGQTQEDAQKRRSLLVKLCRDYHFLLFKFDAVCGPLRKEKQNEFAQTLLECRKYSPDLILLNHRNDLGNEEKYATTFLWQGMETYVDVHAFNTVTAPHNRAYMFFRGHTPELKRLTEDHGVCLSASFDYFEDDLVYQAFNRSLILAPEIYGNPWLMRDDELALLARIFNLHRRYNSLLVNGMLPPCELDLGNNATLRGDGKRRFLSTGNASWKQKEISVPLNAKIGLSPCKKVCIHRYFPTEKFIGCFNYNEIIYLSLPAFRAVLFEICDVSVANLQLLNCEYLVLHEEKDSLPDKINILSKKGDIRLFDPTTQKEFKNPIIQVSDFDLRQQEPRKLISCSPCAIPKNVEQMYETAYFFSDNDSLERRSLNRSGRTDISELKVARDYFFNQPSYILRGLDTNIPFDGNENSIFDTKSRSYYNFNNLKGYRVEGGCLRVDFSETIQADRIEIEYFDAEGKVPYMFEKQIPLDKAEVSLNLDIWEKAPLKEILVLRNATNSFFAFYEDKLCSTTGKRKKVVYSVENADSFRFFRLPEPMDRIYSIKLFKGNHEIKLKSPRLTNLFAPYTKKQTQFVSIGKVRLNNLPSQPYLAVAIEGETGNENVACIAEKDGKLYAFPSRAPAYPANAYEYPVHPVNGFYTFYLPLKKEDENNEIIVYILFAGSSVPVDIWLCDGHGKREGIICDLPIC